VAAATPDTPPTITINGDDPAIMRVGDSYADLGATPSRAPGTLNLINVSKR
jgi:hypothetical protein